MLLLNTLPTFAQITDVIPTGGEWNSIFRPEPFDSINAACEFQFDIVGKQTSPVPACRIRRLSGKNTYIPFPNGMGGFGKCPIEEPKIESKIIDGKHTLVCTGFIEIGNPTTVIYKAPTCPVEPLKLITDPVVLAMEKDPVQEGKLNLDMYAKTQCLKSAASAAGITFTVTSAWRPQPYQDHLRDIFDKMTALDLESNQIPACIPVRNAIEKHRAFHGIAVKQNGERRPVAIKSKHPVGNAIDASWNSSDAKIDQVAATCGLCRPYKNPKVKGYDKPHFEVCK